MKSRDTLYRKSHTPPNYVVEDGTTQRKPPEVRMWTLRNQSRVGTRPPSTSTPHFPACLARCSPLRKGHSRFCIWLRCSANHVRSRSCTGGDNCKTIWTKLRVSKIS